MDMPITFLAMPIRFVNRGRNAHGIPHRALRAVWTWPLKFRKADVYSDAHTDPQRNVLAFATASFCVPLQQREHEERTLCSFFFKRVYFTGRACVPSRALCIDTVTLGKCST